MNTTPFPRLAHTRRTCGSCGIKLLAHEDGLCLKCLTGADFYAAARAYAAANPKPRKPRRWSR